MSRPFDMNPKKELNLVNLATLGFHTGPPHMKRHMLCHAITAVILFFVYLHWNGGLVPWFMRTPAISRNDDPKLSVDVLKFFPQAQNDGTKVVWAHGTNSKASLEAAVKGHSMMVEGDISLKGLGTDKQSMVAVMGQPPATNSDLTFDEWLQAIQDTDKGLKLDFQNIESVELCLQKLRVRRKQLQRPVHLSAAILEGPNKGSNGLSVVDPQRFGRLVKEHFPRGTVVVGWRDGAPISDEGEARYSWDHVYTMQNTVEKWGLRQPVSYSVRASLAKHSLSQVRWLMEMTDKSSITVIAPQEDKVPVLDMLHVRSMLPSNRVLYDIHAELMAQFTPIKDKGIEAMHVFKTANVHSMDHRALIDETTNRAKRQNMTFRGQDWTVGQGGVDQKVYLGTQAVVFQKSLLISKLPMKPTTGNPVRIQGSVEFFNLPETPEPKENIVFELFLQISKYAQQSKISGIRCSINIDGTADITFHNVDGKDENAQANIPGTGPCFMFEVKNYEGTKVEMKVSRPKSCNEWPVEMDGGESSGVAMAELNTSGVSMPGSFVGLRHDDDKSMVAVNQLKIEL